MKKYKGQSYNPTESCDFIVQLISRYKEAGTGDVNEGIIWQFGLTGNQAINLRLLYEEVDNEHPMS